MASTGFSCAIFGGDVTHPARSRLAKSISGICLSMTVSFEMSLVSFDPLVSVEPATKQGRGQDGCTECKQRDRPHFMPQLPRAEAFQQHCPRRADKMRQ